MFRAKKAAMKESGNCEWFLVSLLTLGSYLGPENNKIRGIYKHDSDDGEHQYSVALLC